MKRTSVVIALIFYVFTGYSQESGPTNEERLEALESKVEKMGQFKFSGYVQTQWTWNQAEVSNGKQNDFSIRRGRVKLTYTNKYGEAVFQLDATESGVNIKDAYLRIREPRVKWASLRAGVFDRPFGYEISYSSSARETPERSRIFQTLFPKERDLGAEIALKGSGTSFLKDFTLNAGIFAGNGGQAKETDSHKDFIGHLAYQKTTGNISFGLGTSLYAGGVRLAGDENQKTYKMVNKSFTEDKELTPGDYARRRYYGFDGQFALTSPIGKTSLRAEYLWGIQPGSENGSNSPTGAINANIYSRDFNGYYLYFIQDIGKTKHSLVARYDMYDPNTEVSKNECVTLGDIAYSTFGFGWLFRANSNLRLMAYYELVNNEKVKNNTLATAFADNIPDNLFTLRLQYKF